MSWVNLWVGPFLVSANEGDVLNIYERQFDTEIVINNKKELDFQKW